MKTKSKQVVFFQAFNAERHAVIERNEESPNASVIEFHEPLKRLNLGQFRALAQEFEKAMFQEPEPEENVPTVGNPTGIVSKAGGVHGFRDLVHGMFTKQKNSLSEKEKADAEKAFQLIDTFLGTGKKNTDKKEKH